MEWLVGLALLIVILIWLFIPRKPKHSPKPRSKKYPTSGAVLFGINEVFAPSAANATIIQEEKRESRKAMPSPEDKII